VEGQRIAPPAGSQEADIHGAQRGQPGGGGAEGVWSMHCSEAWFKSGGGGAAAGGSPAVCGGRKDVGGHQFWRRPWQVWYGVPPLPAIIDRRRGGDPVASSCPEDLPLSSTTDNRALAQGVFVEPKSLNLLFLWLLLPCIRSNSNFPLHTLLEGRPDVGSIGYVIDRGPLSLPGESKER
jgi:hypothetical protein